jgi:hypothetical protein
MMRARTISTLSPTRDNIHRFQAAKEGARGIDINTLHGPIGPFSFLDMKEKAVDAEKGIYEVMWNPELVQPPTAK